jgi:hypothetical protein
MRGGGSRIIRYNPDTQRTQLLDEAGTPCNNFEPREEEAPVIDHQQVVEFADDNILDKSLTTTPAEECTSIHHYRPQSVSIHDQQELLKLLEACPPEEEANYELEMCVVAPEEVPQEEQPEAQSEEQHEELPEDQHEEQPVEEVSHH